MEDSGKNLKHLVKCPVCEKKYQHGRTLLIEDDGDKTTFHLTCQNCLTSTLVFVSRSQMGLVSLGMATDLSAGDVKDFFGKEPISADQVMDVYEFMKEKNIQIDKFI
ncbi:MAG: hypothetical protein M0P97_04360 [Candidatus Moranbacteria bacterium]|nr:hypothetical protein [Candidatus Moranbacteria bacterium]